MAATFKGAILVPELTEEAIKYEVPGIEPILPRLVLPASARVVKVPIFSKDWFANTGVHERDLGASYQYQTGGDVSTQDVVLKRMSKAEIIDRDDPTLAGKPSTYVNTLADRARLLKDALIRALSVEEAQALVNESNYGSVVELMTPWDAGGDFYSDIVGAINTIVSSIGVAPDTLVIPQKVLYKLVNTSTWADKVKYTQVPSLGGAAEVLKTLFAVKRVVIPPAAIYLSETGTPVDLFDDKVAVLFLGEGYNLRIQGAPIFGAVLTAQGYPKIYRAEREEGVALLADYLWKVATFVKEAGVLIKNTLS